MQNITPFLWFDGEAEKAAKYYVSVFKKDSEILEVSRYGAGGPGKKGSVMTVSFKANGTRFTALNGGSYYKLNPAVSFVVECRDQKEIDYYWSKLGKGGQEQQCGWLVDQFGVSWQIVPKGLGKLLRSPKAVQAMMQMVKFDLAALKAAAREK